MSELQQELFEDADFEAWRHTHEGAEITNRFIRLAIGLHRSGFRRYSQWQIVGRIRWHYDIKARRGGYEPGKYKINNNWIAHLARFAERRAPELEGFFELRALGPRRRNKVVVVYTDKPEAHIGAA